MVTAAWVTPFPPDRNGGGGQIRLAHLLLGLAARASIELICPGPVDDPAVLEAVATLTEVDPPESNWRVAHPWLRRAADLAATAGSSQPMEVRAFRPYRRALAPALAQVSADLVLVEFAGLAPLLPTPRTGQWVLDFQNLPSRMAAQQAAVMPHRRQRWWLRGDAATAVAFEARAADAFDAVMVCTTADAAAIGPPGRTMDRMLIVPNGVDVARFRPVPLPVDPRIVFTGAMYTTPNVDGAQWLCRQVLPLIRGQVPDVRVDLVGARPTDEVRALGDLPGVTLHPDVADVAPFFEAARVAVVPIRIGSGSRLKALEAMAAGRPVVGTTIGLEGLDLQPGRDVLLADDPAAFATATVRLMQEDSLAASLAQAGRAVVEARFDWPAIATAFVDAVLAMTSQPEAG